MNYLAHAWLAGDLPADRLGGLIGDFVKGPLPAGLPADVAAGVRLHRQIDVFADTHPAFRRSRERVTPLRRRFGGVMVDMFYDHFLARHWMQYHPLPLEHFSAEMYRLMGIHAPLLPPALAAILPRMREADWLASYRSPDAIAIALDRMAMRLRRANPLPGAGEELRAGYAGFEADFFDFIVDAERFAAEQRRNRPGGA
jgi:acyl carrier protein phosphodiesterase